MAKENAQNVYLTKVHQRDSFEKLEKAIGAGKMEYFATGERLAKKLESELPSAVIIDEDHIRNLPEFVEIVFTQKPGRRFIPAAVLTDDPKISKSRFSKCHFPITLIQRDSYQELLEFIRRALKPSVKVKFWGVRGSTPCANSENIFYGGNTSCVQIEIPGYDKLLILDSGTGIRNLGNFLENYSSGPIHGDLFITHPHWDHIQGFPFFTPFYEKENSFRIHLPEQYRGGAEEILSGHLTKTFFPVTLDMLASDLTYVTQKEEPERMDAFSVDYLVANHPTKTAIYRFRIKDYTIIYAPDNELPLTASPLRYIDKFCDFIKDCDLLIHDGQFNLETFKTREGWGHSAWERVLELAKSSGVKRLILTHHDPNSDDEYLNRLSGIVDSYRGNPFEMIEFAREGKFVALPLNDTVEISNIES
ncbi:hypothetical protein DYD21_16550 [Rhodohalobacter sp. SW132]|uniref:MBL fold metallo-hydrolase n=1 Tax=Rhodohalobacter sp. SW132 TaxID=2293433 RepID=UPI000E27D56A|nr:MBL fold metallo-hydrolase [Rhodohalobacter sp. SW132]REL24774.1 hypothetical protein DYD21_16550 [Rhodohalobacter sp. SW132]